MTKYVLNSGGISRSADRGKSFSAELVKGLGSNPKFLLCLFAKPREEWETKCAELEQSFAIAMPDGVSPAFFMAFPEKFMEQVATSDVLYLHGGDDHLIQYWLKQYNVPHIWDGKVVGTNSASSHALAKHFWTCDWRQCMDGLSILPIKFLAHYHSAYGENDPRGPINWQKAYKELSAYGDTTLPICALPEGDFRVFEA